MAHAEREAASGEAGISPSAWRDVPALAFALLFPTAMTWFYFVVMSQQEGKDNPGLRLTFTTGKAVQFLFPLIYVGTFETFRLRQGMRRPTVAGLRLGIGFGLMVGASALVCFYTLLRGSSWIEQTPALILTRVQQFGLASPLGFLGLAVFYSVVHSLLEEYYWRWFVFGWLKRYLPLAAAIVISSVGFTLHHVVILYVYFPGQFWLLALPFSLAVAIGGGFWAWLCHASGSLYGPWVSHLLVDAALMAIGALLLAPYWD
jgi:membrane protease YdiL (CAAX protease family)